MFSPANLMSDGLRVARMRVRSSDPDRLRARQRIEAQLVGIDASSIGLPSRTLLFVRRAAARIDVPFNRARGNTVARAVSSELARCVARARRPWIDPDASRADVVLFADETELVACLIRDWVRGVVADRWWWPSVLGSAGAERWLREHVFRRGDILVPALSSLMTRIDVVRWIARLAESDARVAAASVADAFALPMPAISSYVAPAATSDSGEDLEAPSTRDRITKHAAASAMTRLMATVPELRSPVLGREHRRLLALVGVATRAPSWARTPQFTAAIVALDRIELEPHTIVRVSTAIASERTRAERVSHDDPSPRLATRRIDTPSPPQLPADDEVRMTHSLSTPAPPREDVTIDETRQAPSGVTGESSTRSNRDREIPVAHGARGESPREDIEADTPVAMRADEMSARENESVHDVSQADVDAPPTARATRIETQYGGIFYLLNAWLAMELYGDFTAPRAKNVVLSPWDLLALVGRAWFGRAFVLDPVWKVLADLAVRDPEEDPARDVELPDGWIEQHLDTLGTRLRSALGVEDASDVAGIVCRHRAAIEVTASSLHLHLALCDLPLDIRIAGLDRDPGWIPAAGRAVYFHFS